MTPQEALARALGQWFADHHPDDWTPRYIASAVLGALHDEGYDVRPTPTVTVLRERQIYEDGMAHGAQQERERLSNKAERWRRDGWLPNAVALRLTEGGFWDDPEDDR